MGLTREQNTAKCKKYRAKHKDKVQKYNREYQSKNYNSPTIRLTQVRQNIKSCITRLAQWQAEEAELLIKQAALQAEEITLGNWLNGQT